MKIGYARVSTDDQENHLQEDALRKAGCEKIYSDKISGKTTSRPGFDKMIAEAKSGDHIIVWKLDRLGRSLLHVVTTVNGFGERKINFSSLTETIDTTTPVGEFTFQIMAALAELERKIIAQRTKAGIAASRTRSSKSWGRQPAEAPPEVVKLLQEGYSIREVAEKTGINRGKIHRISKLLKTETSGDLV